MKGMEWCMRTQMQVSGDHILDFAVGAQVVLFATVIAIHFSLIDNDGMVKPSLVPMRMYLSFDRSDTDHECEIADSEPLHDGASTE
jgi:hypothetical protein